MIDYDDATDGIARADNVEMKGELILETFLGIYSKRLYKFKDDQLTWFLWAERDLKSPHCPECGEEFFGCPVDEDNGNDHHPDCKFRFSKEKLEQLELELNKDYEKWIWFEDPYYDYEFALSHLFENMHMRNKKEYAAFKPFQDMLNDKHDEIGRKTFSDFHDRKYYEKLYEKNTRQFAAKKQK